MLLSSDHFEKENPYEILPNFARYQSQQSSALKGSSALNFRQMLGGKEKILTFATSYMIWPYGLIEKHRQRYSAPNSEYLFLF